MTSSKWVAEKVVDALRTNPGIKVGQVKAEVRKNYIAEVSMHKAYCGRKLTKEKLHGSFIEQYKKLWDYCVEVRRTNQVAHCRLLWIGMVITSNRCLRDSICSLSR